MNKNITFSTNLYLSESMNLKKVDKLKKKIITRPAMTKTFLLTISTNPLDQLDIIESKYLAFPYYNACPIHVVGFADTNAEAIRLVENIANDCLKKRGDVNLKAYLQENI